MRDLRELGVAAFGKRPFPVITDAALREFERAFDVSLPASYVQFLHFANGGTLKLQEYDDPETGGIGGINDFYGLGSRDDDERARLSGKWDYGNLWGERRMFRQLCPKAGVPFARDGGDNQLFLDYSEPDVRVSRLIFETRTPYVIAQSFELFLQMLHLRSPRPGRTRSSHTVRFGREMRGD